MVAWCRKSFSLIVVAAALSMSLPRSSEAISLVFEPEVATVAQGETLFVGVKLTELRDTLVGTYDVTVSFDPLLLTLSSLRFGGLGGFTDVSSASIPDVGTVEAFELSFASDLSGQHSGDLLLFTLEFQGLGTGESSLSFSNVILGNENGDPLTEQLALGTGSVEVTPTVIPEPGTLLLLFSGLAGLAWRRGHAPAPRG